MPQEENLFATPERPGLLRITVDRLWEKGDDVVGLTIVTMGAKSALPRWTSAVEYQGPHWDRAVGARLEAASARFGSSLWSTQPRESTYESWMTYLGA